MLISTITKAYCLEFSFFFTAASVPTKDMTRTVLANVKIISFYINTCEWQIFTSAWPPVVNLRFPSIQSLSAGITRVPDRILFTRITPPAHQLGYVLCTPPRLGLSVINNQAVTVAFCRWISTTGSTLDCSSPMARHACTLWLIFMLLIHSDTLYCDYVSL